MPSDRLAQPKREQGLISLREMSHLPKRLQRIGPTVLATALVLAKRIGHWSLTSFQQRLVKTPGQLIKHARYYWLLLAEVHLARRLFACMLCGIEGLPSPAG
jgi:hypothetical protein